jgi:glycosyltransferase involved in cell wall biosynthesis
VIPNYYDLDDFPEHLLLSHQSPDLLYVGRMIRRKGLQIAVEVARRTGRKLTIAGQGLQSETDTDYITEDDQKLPKSICNYVGYVTPRERAVLVSQAHALLAPTTYLEPFGGVAVEAQLCGIPAITTNYGGFTETVKHALTGWRCHTLSQFVQATETPVQCNRRQIREYAASNFSIGRVRHMYNEYFKSLSSLWDEGWYQVTPGDSQVRWLVQNPPICN